MGRKTVGLLGDSNLQGTSSSPEPAQRYMPVPGGKADDLNGLEVDWHHRLTYPTGRFDPAWVRRAAEHDASISRGIPAGLQLNINQSSAALGLDPNGFTALGPQPLRMTGC